MSEPGGLLNESSIVRGCPDGEEGQNRARPSGHEIVTRVHRRQALQPGGDRATALDEIPVVQQEADADCRE